MGKSVSIVLSLKDKCSPQLQKVADKLGMTTKEAKIFQQSCNKLNKEMTTGLKTACKTIAIGLGALTGAMALTINKTAELGDRIDKMSQKIGISRKTFQELDYVFSQNGADVESLKMGFKTFVKQIDGVNLGTKTSVRNFKELGVSVKHTNGTMKNQEELFNEVLSALQKMPDGVNKARIANEMFGRSGADMMPLLSKNATAIDDLRKKANDLGLVMSDDAVNASVTFTDNMDTISRSFQMFGVMLASDLMPKIIEVQNTLISNMPQIKATVLPILNGLGEAIKFAIDNMSLIAPVVSGVVGAFATFNIITGVIKTIQTLKLAIDLVRMSTSLWNVVMLANPIGIVAVAIGGLITAITLLAMNWDKVTNTVNKFKNACKGIKNPFSKNDNSDNNTTTPKYATGTSYARGGVSLVGENGPELVNLPRGSKVTSASQTRDKLGRDVVVNVNIAGNVIGNNEFITQIKQVLGLELQRALAV